jgi:hypothetical protein
MDLENKILQLEEENNSLREELEATKVHLKKYTAPASRKAYYENNKEVIKERVAKNRPTPEKTQEYNRAAYLRRKAKQELEKVQDV